LINKYTHLGHRIFIFYIVSELSELLKSKQKKYLGLGLCS